jgi:hypothetical protein
MRYTIALLSFIVGFVLSCWSIYTHTPTGGTITGIIVLFNFIFIYNHNVG